MVCKTEMRSCASLKAEYDAIDSKKPCLEPEIQKSLLSRIGKLNAEDRSTLNLAVNYGLEGKATIVLAVFPSEHPMRDLFTSSGEPKGVPTAEYIKDFFAQQQIQTEIARLMPAFEI